jgi:hypothetical protein
MVKIYHRSDKRCPLTDLEKKEIVSCLKPIEILSLFVGYYTNCNTTSAMIESMYERLQMHRFIIISNNETFEDIKFKIKDKYVCNSTKINMGALIYYQKDLENIFKDKNIAPLNESEQQEIVSSLEPDDILSIFYGYYKDRESGNDMVENLFEKLNMMRYLVITKDEFEDDESFKYLKI